MTPLWIYFGTLPSLEDSSRYTAPPEPSDEHWEEPEDHIDHIDTLTETETP